MQLLMWDRDSACMNAKQLHQWTLELAVIAWVALVIMASVWVVTSFTG